MAASPGSGWISFRRCVPPSPEDRQALAENISGEKRVSVLFGRRKGHALRPHRAELIETLLPSLALDLGAADPKDAAALFPATGVQALRLEIGFGAGEHLLAEALRHPGTGFIGAEPFLNGMASVLAGISDSGLENVRLHQGDAGELLDWLPDACLSEVDLLYPDPWPKRRHWKRRFIQKTNLERLARVIAIGGVLRFATDWADYAAWGLAQAMRVPEFRWTAERARDWRAPWPNWQGTRYEAKALREGRRPVYLTFERVAPSQ